MTRLCYLLAASHSGSTLLAMLLGAQPGACTVGELKATALGDVNSYRCSCREKIRDCSFWRQINAAMDRRGIPNFDITQAGTSILETSSPYVQRLLAPLYRGGFLEIARDLALHLSSEWRRLLKETQHRNLTFINSLLEVTGAQVVIDSSKLALRLKYLLTIPDLDIQVIHLVRDGRAVAMTYTDEWNFADSADPQFRGGGCGIRRPPSRPTITEAAREWRRSNEAAEALLQTLPRSQWTRVRYEDLCTDPTATLQRLVRFLDLDPQHVRLDYRAAPQHVIGNGMRLDTTAEIQLDERWKSQLSQQDLNSFDKVSSQLNREYGYR